MTVTPELDPVAIRQRLELHREAGHQFEEAWLDVVGLERDHPDERAACRFMKAHFRAAYYNDATAKGRCLIPECDVSNALLMAYHPAPPSDHVRCQSGDGCDRLATCGRFGRTFCQHHGEELVRLRLRLFTDGQHFGRGREVARSAA